MAEYSRFFPSIASDRLYTASQVDEYLYETLEEENGVLHLPTGSAYDGMLAVTNDGTLSVDIDTGCAVKSGVLYLNDASLHKALSTVTSGNLRIDRIVIRTSVANRNMVATIITGTETTGTPVAPAIVDATDVLLAQILIDRSTGTYAYTVTDERVYRPYVFVSDAALAAAIHAASAKTTFADSDEIGLADSGDSFNLKHITAAYVWAWIKTKIAALSTKTTPIDADSIAMIDSADTDDSKRLTFANLWVWIQAKIFGATAKDAPIDADSIAGINSAASNVVTRFTFANLWAWVIAKIEGSTNTTTPNDTDVVLGIKADHTSLKYTWANIKAAIATYLDRASTTVKGIMQFATTGVEDGAKVPKALGAEIAALLTAGGYSLSPATGSDNLDNIADGTTYKRTQAAIANMLNGGTGEFYSGGYKYRICAGTIRNNAGTWEFITTSGHTPLNLASVAGDTGKVRVTYGFTANAIASFIAIPDDTYTLAGISCGTSVGAEYTDIYFRKSQVVEGYVVYNGSAWVVYSGIAGKTATFSDWKIIITHEDIGADTIYGANVNSRYIGYIACPDGVSRTTLSITMYDRVTGAVITSPDTNMKVYFQRAIPAKLAVDPSTLTNTGSNVWLLGVFRL